MKSKLLMIVLSMGFAAQGLAQSSVGSAFSTLDAQFLEIGDVVIEEVPQTLAEPVPAKERLSQGLFRLNSENSLNEADVKLDLIINMGKKVWKIIEAGRPVVTTNFEMAHALPGGVNSWEQMSGWRNPEARSYRIHAKNLYGITVIDFTYRVTFTSGGSYKGLGRYLTRVSVRAENLDVAWGYTFDAGVEVPSVTNSGSVDNPMAAIEMIVKWKISTVMKSNDGSASYLMRGDGLFKSL